MLHNAELHAAVLAAPDDDAPRLVYADWLQLRGDPRGELVAIQLARRTSKRLVAREHDLLESLRRSWLAPLRQRRTNRWSSLVVTHRRGFAEIVGGDHDELRDVMPDVLRDACIRELRIAGCPADELADLVAPWLSRMRLRALELPDLRGEPAALPQGLDDLAHLGLAGARLDARILAMVLRAVPRVRGLDLAACGLGPDLVRVLPRGLERLVLSANPLGAGAVATLAVAQPHLRELGLAHTGIDDADIAALAGSRLALRRLDLTGNDAGARWPHALARAPNLAGLRWLGLARTGIDAKGFAALIASPHLPRTLELVVDCDEVGLSPLSWDFGDGGVVFDGARPTHGDSALVSRLQRRFTVRVTEHARSTLY